MPAGEPAVQDDFDAEGLEVNVPALDQRIEEGYAVSDRDTENIRVQEFQNRDPHLFIASLAEPSHQAEPFFTIQFFFGHAFGYIEQLLRDQAFQLSKRLLLKNSSYLLPLAGIALAENQLPEVFEQRAGRVGDLLSQLFPALQTGQLGKFAA